MAKAKKIKAPEMNWTEASNFVQKYLEHFAKTHATDSPGILKHSFKLGCAESMLATLLSKTMTVEEYVESLHRSMANLK